MKKGFTVLELLITVGIIAILAAIAICNLTPKVPETEEVATQLESHYEELENLMEEIDE